MPFSSFTFRLDLQISDDASLYVVTEGWGAEDELISKNMAHTTPMLLPIYLNLPIPSYPICLQLNFLNANFTFPKPSCRRRRQCQRIIDNDVDTFATRSHTSTQHSVRRFNFTFAFILHSTLSSRHTFTQITFPLRFSARVNFSHLYFAEHVCWMLMEASSVFDLGPKFLLPVVFPFE